MKPVQPYLKVQFYRTTPSVAWVDIGNDLIDLRFRRGNSNQGVMDTLEIGDLSITIKGDTWSPATNPSIRPGTLICVIGVDSTGTQQNLYYGTLGIPTVTYSGHKPITVFPAIDVIGNAGAAVPATGLQGGSMNTRLGSACLVRSGVRSIARNMVGSTDSSSASFLYDAPGSVLEAMTIVKNSRLGWIWSSRDIVNCINFRTSASAPDVLTPLMTFSDSLADTGSTVHYYTDIEVSHDAENFITGLSLNFPDGSADAGVHGPYRDNDAVTAGWSRRDEEITLTDRFFNISSLAYNAMIYLGSQPLPKVTVKSVTIDALRNRQAFSSDWIYTPVRVKHAQSGTNAVYHIIAEEHHVTPSSWFITYDLKTTYLSSRFPTVTDES